MTDNIYAIWKDWRTGAYEIEFYGEGGFDVEAGSASRQTPQGMVKLTTRGDIRLSSRNQKTQETSMPTDAVYQRAEQARSGPAAPAKLAATLPTVVPAGGVVPGGTPAGGEIQTVKANVVLPNLNPFALGQAIPVELYAGVAEILAYVYRLSNKRRRA